MNEARLMFLYNTDKSFLKSLLKNYLDGNIKNILLSEILDLLSENLERDFLFLIFKIFRKHRYIFRDYINQIASKLKIDIDILEKIFDDNSKEFEFYFPITDGKNVDICRGFLIISPESRNVFCNFDSKVKSIKKLLDILNLQVDVIILFDKDFLGNSFELPLYYILEFENEKIFNKFILSGSVEPDGKIILNESISKEKLAKKLDKKLLKLSHIKDFKTLIPFLKGKILHIPLFFSIDKDNYFFNFLEEHILLNFNLLKEIFNIDKKDLLFNIEVDESKAWYEILDIIGNLFLENVFWKIKNNYKPIFHIAFKIPSVLSLGLGIKFDCGKVPMIIYHFFNRKYIPAIDLNQDPRKIKTIMDVDPFDFIEIKKDTYKNFNSNKDLIALISIQLASHTTKGYEFYELRDNLKVSEIYYLYPKNKNNIGNIPFEIWHNFVKEIYSAISYVKSKGYKKLALVMSMPVFLVFALGLALGNYWNIDVYHFSRKKEKYIFAFNAKELSFIF